MRKLLLEATKLAGVQAEEIKPEDDEPDSDLEFVGVPEESNVGESQSNGRAERSVQLVKGQLRTMKLALEDKLQRQIPCSHPIIAWMIEYSALLISKYQPGDDGKTKWERMHGQPARERLPEFGETVLFVLPKHARRDADPRWMFGVISAEPRLPTNMLWPLPAVR